jgi:hypothetical protein
MTEQIPPIPIVPSPPTPVQVVPEVTMLRYEMDRIVKMDREACVCVYLL